MSRLRRDSVTPLVAWLLTGWLTTISLLPGCGVDEPGDAELQILLERAPMTPERREAFAAELATATERIDYRGLDPAEVAEGRKLMPTNGGGRSFRRYVIDGREETPESHPALRSGQSAGRSWQIPYYYDPAERFVVVRSIFKVTGKVTGKVKDEVTGSWEVISEDWIYLPADHKNRALLLSVIRTGEVAGGEDAMSGRSVGIRGFKPRGFKTRVTPAPAAGGNASNTGPARQSKASAKARREAQRSGLTVVRRPDMTVRTVQDARGNSVSIYGQSGSSSTTRGHERAMQAEATRMARSGEYEYVTIQRSWRTATGRVSESRKIPDIIGVRRNGRVDAVEIRSKTDKMNALQKRLEAGQLSLPAKHRGDIRILEPND